MNQGESEAQEAMAKQLQQMLQSQQMQKAMQMAQRAKQQSQQGQPQQTPPQPSTASSQTGQPPQGIQESDLKDLDLRTRSMILQLPPRVREELLQGMKEEGPEGFRKYIQEYFKRLSELQNK